MLLATTNYLLLTQKMSREMLPQAFPGNLVEDFMSENNEALAVIGEIKRESGKVKNLVPDMPKSVQRVFSPRCKVCISEYCDIINQQIALGKTSTTISRRLAEMGEEIHPNSISNHKKRHIKDLEIIRQFYLRKTDLNLEQELKAQIHLTKYELNGTIEQEHRRFLMRRMDSLMKLLSEHQIKLAKASNPQSIDQRRISITQVHAPTHNEQNLNVIKPRLSLEEIATKLNKIHTAIDSGKLTIVNDESGESMPKEALSKQIIAPKPSTSNEID